MAGWFIEPSEPLCRDVRLARPAWAWRVVDVPYSAAWFERRGYGRYSMRLAPQGPGRFAVEVWTMDGKLQSVSVLGSLHDAIVLVEMVALCCEELMGLLDMDLSYLN